MTNRELFSAIPTLVQQDRRVKYPFIAMEIGEEIIMPISDLRGQTKARNAAHQQKRNSGHIFACEAVSGGLRVKRVE